MSSTFIVILIICFFLSGVITGSIYLSSIQKRHYTKKYRFKNVASERIHADAEILYADKREQHSNKNY